ncbi:MAG TPA: FlgO family outer membrane protein [Blastocatellia bacterium]|nr:FlgO family outer membrane protein [Blastocatellia bacterium]
MCNQTKRFYEFGPFRIDTVNRRLTAHGETVPLKQKAVETLLVLVENRGEVLEKQALIERLWPDSFVEEANLTQNIYMLRKALGAYDYIETVPRRGYRFSAEVREWEEGVPDLIVKERMRSSIVIEEEEEIKADAELIDAVAPLVSLAAQPQTRRQTAPLIWAAVFLLAVLGVAVYLWTQSKARKVSAGAAPSIAVLPFKSLNADGTEDYLGLGMADTLITRLSRVGRAVVRPTSSVRRYTAGEADAIQAGQELGVDFVLDGSIQRSDDRVRVTARLVRTRDGQPLWADKFDEPFTDLFKVQDAISEKLAAALALKLSGAEQQRLSKRQTASTEAYQLYLKGRYFWDKRTEEGLKKSTEYFQQAIDLDPAFALAYSGLADAYAQLPGYGPTASMEVYPKARAAAARALELDGDLAEAHNSMAAVLSYFEWDWAAAEDEYRKALALDPNYAAAHHRLGVQLAAMSRTDEAISELQRAQALDPLSLIVNALLGFTYYQARQYDQAIAQLKKTIEMDKHFPPAHEILAHIFAEKGMEGEAFAEFLETQRLTGEGEEKLAAYRKAFADTGLKGFYRQRLDFLLAQSAHNRIQPTTLASLYASLGETEQALSWLERAVEQHEGEVIWLKARRDYDSLRRDPRFANLLKRINLDQ